MSALEVYSFVLCFIVFCLLGGLSTAMLIHMYKLQARLYDVGAEDEAITIEYQKKMTEKKSRVWDVVDKVTSGVLLVFLCLVFVFSLYMQLTEAKRPNGIPSLKVVKSPSMSYIHKDNTKLKELGIDNQIGTYDLVLTHHLPAEEDLKLYDIVLYEKDDGMLVIHRIVEIEEPNANHPNCRYFVLQGDANKYPDRIPVYYTQMRGIYRGERIPFVGSFVMFMQSPAGWICIFYVILVSAASPIFGKKLGAKKEARLAELGLLGASAPEGGGDA